MENIYNPAEELDIEISSTSLGNTNEQGGTLGAIKGLAMEAISKKAYTDTVVKNALEAEEITKESIPGATFGVSALASAIDPSRMKDLISSVDYPYLVKFNKDFLKEKYQRVKEQGYSGLGLGIALGQEYAYALLQYHSEKGQKGSVIDAVESMSDDIVKVRTCIETATLVDEIRKIREVNFRLKNEGRNVTWLLEPNSKMGDGKAQDFLNMFEQVKNDQQNRDLHFGIDLDMGGLPKEDKDLFSLVELFEKYNSEYLPVYLSLSGQEFRENSVRTHLPLGDNEEFSKKLGQWLKERQFKGQKLPGIVIETSPTGNVLGDYKKFLDGLKKGFN